MAATDPGGGRTTNSSRYNPTLLRIFTQRWASFFAPVDSRREGGPVGRATPAGLYRRVVYCRMVESSGGY